MPRWLIVIAVIAVLAMAAGFFVFGGGHMGVGH